MSEKKVLTLWAL